MLSHLVGDECLIQLYPNLLVLAQILMVHVFPASSVDCEHGFSVQNHIKTKTRNRLVSKHLNVRTYESKASRRPSRRFSKLIEHGYTRKNAEPGERQSLQQTFLILTPNLTIVTVNE